MNVKLLRAIQTMLVDGRARVTVGDGTRTVWCRQRNETSLYLIYVHAILMCLWRM